MICDVDITGLFLGFEEGQENIGIDYSMVKDSNADLTVEN